MKPFLLLILLFSIPGISAGQYLIEGKIENSDTNLVAYLSILNRWDEFTTVGADMILKQSPINERGEFRFTGNELSEDIGYYKIHFANASQTPVYITGSPTEKNYFIFLLSNADSILIKLKSCFYNIGEIQYQSGIPDNQGLLEAIGQLDEFTVAEDNSESDNQRQLIKDKKEKYALDQIFNSQNAAANLYALYCSHLEIDVHGNAFQQVADQLEAGKLREVYFATLEEFIGSKFYRKLQSDNARLRNLLFGVAGLAALFLLIAVFLFVKRPKKESPPDADQISESAIVDQLTAKENEVMELIQSDLTNKEIASQLFISESTVKTHINNIYRKTKLKSRAEIKRLKS